MVSTRPPTFKSSSPFNNPLVTVPKAPITIGIIVTSMLYSFFQFSCKVEVLILLFTFFQFYSGVSWNSKVDNFADSLLFFLGGVIIIRSSLLAEIIIIIIFASSSNCKRSSFPKQDLNFTSNKKSTYKRHLTLSRLSGFSQAIMVHLNLINLNVIMPKSGVSLNLHNNI